MNEIRECEDCKNSMPASAMIFVLILTIVTTIGVTCGITSGVWKREAVREGHAEYVVDKNGDAEWQWKSLKKEGK